MAKPHGSDHTARGARGPAPRRRSRRRYDRVPRRHRGSVSSWGFWEGPGGRRRMIGLIPPVTPWVRRRGIGSEHPDLAGSGVSKMLGASRRRTGRHRPARASDSGGVASRSCTADEVHSFITGPFSADAIRRVCVASCDLVVDGSRGRSFFDGKRFTKSREFSLSEYNRDVGRPGLAPSQRASQRPASPTNSARPRNSCTPASAAPRGSRARRPAAAARVHKTRAR